MLIIVIIIGILLYQKNDYVIIPNESIRIRIIANSNSISDLYNKTLLKKQMEQYIYNLLNDVNSIDDARDIINNNLDSINKEIEGKVNENYSLNYGFNYFPKKIYKGVLYRSGYYESLVITLGSGLGNNWWCVLYPPLCLIDDNQNIDNVEYKLLIQELLED